MKYAVAPAPGYFGAKTEILSVHSSWSEALKARGFGKRLAWAIYACEDGTEAGETLWGDMMPRRLDRRPGDAPEAPYFLFQYPSDVRAQFGERYEGWFVEDKEAGRNIAGPIQNRDAAKKKHDSLSKAWQREWATGMRERGE